MKTSVKVRAWRLLQEADKTMREGGVDPELGCIGVLESWLKAKPEHFARLAVNCGLEPTPELICAFLDKLRERVAKRYPTYFDQLGVA